MRKKRIALVLLCLCLLSLWGCADEELPEAEQETVEAFAPETVPEDGNPEDVTCKGTYTGSGEDNTVVAKVGDAMLTNGQLRAWYYSTIAQYQLENHPNGPDFSKPLDTQECWADDSVNSWQQYFLREALDNWHKAQALEVAARTDKIVTEEAYQPDPEQKSYMDGMPVTEVLYGYHEYYKPNSMHQTYLDQIPELLETLAEEKGYANAKELAEKAFGTDLENLEAFARLYNDGYMYFTQLSYDAVPEAAEEKATAGETYVDIRQILLRPEESVDRKGNVLDAVTVAADGKVTCSEELWTKCENQAKKLLQEWKKTYKETEKGFREMAYKYSQDTASSENGGIYRQIRKGQLVQSLEDWCFDAERKAGDVTTIRTEYGLHIVYFAGSGAVETLEKQQQETIKAQMELIVQMQERFPATVDYEKICLTEAEAAVSYQDVLYPDIAHERCPELPLYLQQDYGDFKFGWDRLYTHGCGITSFALLSSYMMDEEYTPTEMSEQFRRYNSDGTDGMLFIYEPCTIGYYLKARTYNAAEVEQALRDGHKVIALVGPGYWTTTGHYITLEGITEDEKIQVKDTHMFNYKKLEDHAKDKHELKSVFGFGVGGYWVMSKKVTSLPNCHRCGDGSQSIVQSGDYQCEKCEKALLRRNVWLES